MDYEIKYGLWNKIWIINRNMNYQIKYELSNKIWIIK